MRRIKAVEGVKCPNCKAGEDNLSYQTFKMDKNIYIYNCEDELCPVLTFSVDKRERQRTKKQIKKEIRNGERD